MNKTEWRLLGSIGLSAIGGWVVFLVVNLHVYELTGAAWGVAVLYILRPVAALFVKGWCGSVIDRVNKRSLMLWLEAVQLAGICVLAFSSGTLWMIYVMVFLMSAGSAVYQPAALTYGAAVVAPERLQRFNAWRSMLEGGAFLIGPAIAGGLLFVSSAAVAMQVGVLTGCLSALLTFLLPDSGRASLEKWTLRMVREDLHVVTRFTRTHRFIVFVYTAGMMMVVLQTVVDSMEVAFAKEGLGLSDGQYGILVSVAGAGFIGGSVWMVLRRRADSLALLMVTGYTGVAAGYLLFALADTMAQALAGVALLSGANAVANTGMVTFYQKNIPHDLMGRVVSLYGLLEAVLIILLTGIITVVSGVLSVTVMVLAGGVLMLLLSLLLGTVWLLRTYHISNFALNRKS